MTGLGLGDIDPRVVAVLAATLVLGAAVQGLVGLGLGLVTAPVAMLLEPQLMPDLLLWLALSLPLLTLVREHDDIDWQGIRWSMTARVPGTAVGAWLVAVFSDRALGVVVSLVVLLGVVLTFRAVVVPVTRSTLVAAGVTSGITGTATSIGGPPMALLLQHRPPLQIRTTLAVFFLLGAALSLVGLGVSGQLEPTPLLLALCLLPCLPTGFVMARLAHRRVAPELLRPAVLVVCGGSALVLLLRSLI